MSACRLPAEAAGAGGGDDGTSPTVAQADGKGEGRASNRAEEGEVPRFRLLAANDAEIVVGSSSTADEGEEAVPRFEPRDVNVVLTFQVNCPGCFLYAIPLLNGLVDAYATATDKADDDSAAAAPAPPRVGVLGVSTAFEDFDLNTLGNTRALVEDGTIVGETRKALRRTHLPDEDRPRFPIVMDDAEHLAKGAPIPFMSKTFFANGMRGTPTFAITDKHWNIHAAWIGHQADLSALKRMVDKALVAAAADS